jgi:hypothetical protein
MYAYKKISTHKFSPWSPGHHRDLTLAAASAAATAFAFPTTAVVQHG